MGLFEGKKGIVMGVANKYSIASGCAQYLHNQGAKIGYSHLPDADERGRMRKRVSDIVDPLHPVLLEPCDVTRDDQIQSFFSYVAEKMDKIDFLVHSIAFAPLDDIRCPTLEASREGFKQAMDISVYSFIACARAAQKIMRPGGSMVTMTYFGGEKVVAGYNMMGICKAALETTVAYLAYDLGPKGIRVNGLSAGPIKTLASSAIGSFGKMLEVSSAISPLGRPITLQEVGGSCAYLLSDLASGTTGEVLHVDGGYNIMGSPGQAFERLKLDTTPTSK